MDEIVIRGLRVNCRIGVPEEERAADQEVELDVTLQPQVPFDAMGDDVARTVDYAAVCEFLAAEAAARPRKLIETLAADLAGGVVKRFSCLSVTVEVRKFILPETDWVGVRHTCRMDPSHQPSGHER